MTAKNSKRYNCPYCNYRNYRSELIDHIDEDHEDMIPKGYSASRVVYNTINKKDHGTCMICHKETKWDENKQRYDTLCGNPKCKKQYVEIVRSRMVHKYGTYNLLKDPNFQKKMLEGRSISGRYKFEDGGSVGYVGSYEKKFLEFMDKFLHIKSYDIISPGPTIPYKYKGEEHVWITDFLYEPYNLVFDIKDGGDNPNTRDMKEYREKQLAKEKAIAEYGDYNYIRLTDNKFEQLILLMMELKEKDNNNKPIIRINESTLNESCIIEGFAPKFVRIDMDLKKDLTEDILIQAAKEASKFTRWCRMDDGRFCSVHELKNFKVNLEDATFCFAKYTGNEEALKDIIKSCNDNNHFKYGQYEVFSEGNLLYGRITELYRYEKAESIVNESYQNLTIFNAYHLEPNIKSRDKIHGGWDEELYSKTIDAAIANDIKYNYRVKDQDKVSAYVYTAGEDLNPIYLGIITIFDKDTPDWEWEEQETLSDDIYNYIKQNPMESASIYNEEARIEDDKLPNFIYHISYINHDGETFEPRVYDNDNVKNGMERRVKRVCFSDSITRALYSIFPNGAYDADFYVHIPGSECKVYKTTTDDIYDSDITHELWIKEPVEMKCIGKIHVSGVSDKTHTIEVDKEKAGYGKKKYHETRWKWVEKYQDDKTLYECVDISYNDDNVNEFVSNKVIDDFESKQDMNISKFTKITLNSSFVKSHKQEYPSLSRIRINNSTKGCIWVDDNKDIVSMINTEEKEDGYVWINAFEIFGKYKGHGLSKQILKFSIKEYGITHLSVNKNNEVAYQLYKKLGFETYDTTEKMYFMRLK